jgi:hypothetical protein
MQNLHPSQRSKVQAGKKEELLHVLLYAKEALYHACSVLALMITEQTEAGGVDAVGLGDLACK